ncbi:hypothetical protein ACTWQB_01585 [Piscibacillus sp. B03]|uniref:hypothetical protein n=1 Tax=Piscibacillus sp. B03 TaxID=3457430 RepID=UPI003FCCC3C0
MNINYTNPIQNFYSLDSSVQHTIMDSLIGERVMVKLKRHNQIIELQGVLESKSLYLGEVAYDFRISDDLRPIKINLLYDIEQINRIESPTIH